jgi:hypothetical protein
MVAEYLDKWLKHVESQFSPRSADRYGELARKNIAPMISAISAVALAKLTLKAISSASSSSNPT